MRCSRSINGKGTQSDGVRLKEGLAGSSRRVVMAFSVVQEYAIAIVSSSRRGLALKVLHAWSGGRCGGLAPQHPTPYGSRANGSPHTPVLYGLASWSQPMLSHSEAPECTPRCLRLGPGQARQNRTCFEDRESVVDCWMLARDNIIKDKMFSIHGTALILHQRCSLMLETPRYLTSFLHTRDVHQYVFVPRPT